MASGSFITAISYNTIRSKVAEILGVGSSNKGYGQTIISQAVAPGSIITKAQWDDLRFDLLNLRIHQTGVVPVIPQVNRADPVIFGTGQPSVQYNTLADQAVLDRFLLGPGQFVVQNTGSLNYTNLWYNTLSTIVTVTFGSPDQARFFFNSGGKIRLTSSRSGGTNSSQNRTWTGLLSSVGARDFGAVGNTVNFYNLTGNFQTIFSSRSSGIYYSSVYSRNEYKIEARCDTTTNTGGTARTVQFRVSYVDLQPNTFNRYTDGTLNLTIDEVRAQGTLLPEGSGNFSVVRPAITTIPISEAGGPVTPPESLYVPYVPAITNIPPTRPTEIESVVSLSSYDVFTPSGTQNYTTPGDYEFTVPAGVSSLNVELAGGGGSGGFAVRDEPQMGGGGGGSGGYLTRSISVFPGQKLQVRVGRGGQSSTNRVSLTRNGTMSYIAEGFTNLTPSYTTLYPDVTWPSWSSFMKSYAVWPVGAVTSAPAEGDREIWSYEVHIPTDGSYTFTAAADNSLNSLWINDELVIQNFNSFTTTSSVAKTLTAGLYTIIIVGVNAVGSSGNPAGVAATITSGSRIIWTTRYGRKATITGVYSAGGGVQGEDATVSLLGKGGQSGLPGGQAGTNGTKTDNPNSSTGGSGGSIAIGNGGAGGLGNPGSNGTGFGAGGGGGGTNQVSGSLADPSNAGGDGTSGKVSFSWGTTFRGIANIGFSWSGGGDTDGTLKSALWTLTPISGFVGGPYSGEQLITGTPPAGLSLAGQTITYTIGTGGVGGSGASNGNNGGNTSVTFQGITLTGFGGTGGRYNSTQNATGGSFTGGDSGVVGGVGGGMTGDDGGGGGGAIGGTGAPYTGSSNRGQNGAQSADYLGLQAAVTGASYQWLGIGTGADDGTTPRNAKNGGTALGFGSGGGGAGWYGGNGGTGLYGGGGGGASGYSAVQTGGRGGQGAIVCQFVNGTIPFMILTSGTAVTIPPGTTAVRVWVIGAGGGGAGSPAQDGTAGGGGGAGGIAYKTWTGSGYSGSTNVEISSATPGTQISYRVDLRYKDNLDAISAVRSRTFTQQVPGSQSISVGRIYTQPETIYWGETPRVFVELTRPSAVITPVEIRYVYSGPIASAIGQVGVVNTFNINVLAGQTVASVLGSQYQSPQPSGGLIGTAFINNIPQSNNNLSFLTYAGQSRNVTVSTVTGVPNEVFWDQTPSLRVTLNTPSLTPVVVELRFDWTGGITSIYGTDSNTTLSVTIPANSTIGTVVLPRYNLGFPSGAIVGAAYINGVAQTAEIEFLKYMGRVQS